MFNPNVSITEVIRRNTATISDDDNEGRMEVDDVDDQPMQYQQRPRGIGMRYDHGEAGRPDGVPTATSSYMAIIEKEMQTRSEIREDRHAALSVLMDRELLMLQALSKQETLPQARRRFLATLMAPDHPAAAASIRAERFTIAPGPETGFTSPMSVQKTIVDVHETDDSGWFRPESSSSSSSSSRGKGKTPDRSGRSKGKPPSASGTRHHRDRDRRSGGRRSLGPEGT